MNNGALTSPWTDATVARFRQLWDDGRSASEIARELGVSRNAILGKRQRLGMPERLRETPSALPPRQPRLYARAYPKIRYRKPPSKIEADPPPAPIESPCSLLELNNTRCRWPNGDPQEPSFYFCGGTTQRHSYCPFHLRLSHRSAA